MKPPQRLIVVLGDQLAEESPLIETLDEDSALWMAEVESECTHVWSHKARLVQFLSAMRHFREAQRSAGRRIAYYELGQRPESSLAAVLTADIREWGIREVVLMEAGDYRVEHGLLSALGTTDAEARLLEDSHFVCSRDEFRHWLEGRRGPRMESFYRYMRRRHDVLMDDDAPAGGQWNYDRKNRESFGRDGPEPFEQGARFDPDELTREVIDAVASRFADHPGRVDHFRWPVTREQARAALEDFIERRLPRFGDHQDAMWTDRPFLYHSRLSSALNLKLLDPREVVTAAERAYREDRAPLNAVEGFIRQVIGWREYVRGIYFHEMPGYLDSNALQHEEPLPGFYWTGETRMRCLQQVIGQTLEHGYAHHIQRLMVTGLFALVLGVEPRQVHEWYLAVYVDAVEWAEAPNTIGMSQYADGGFLASKPYVATGKYIQRMSNYCRGCPYDPAQRTGESACPFTTLYWDFLLRHRDRFENHPRMALQVRNLKRVDAQEQGHIRNRASELRARLRAGEQV